MSLSGGAKNTSTLNRKKNNKCYVKSILKPSIGNVDGATVLGTQKSAADVASLPFRRTTSASALGKNNTFLFGANESTFGMPVFTTANGMRSYLYLLTTIHSLLVVSSAGSSINNAWNTMLGTSIGLTSTTA